MTEAQANKWMEDIDRMERILSTIKRVEEPKVSQEEIMLHKWKIINKHYTFHRPLKESEQGGHPGKIVRQKNDHVLFIDQTKEAESNYDDHFEEYQLDDFNSACSLNPTPVSNEVVNTRAGMIVNQRSPEYSNGSDRMRK